ncbi:MAG: hypothetical protein ACLRJC_08270 [Emergencia timonensis]|uniref:hypothetical protein n=1 Tax=Emergencia timonensis TaxID=1776384 RepID=UPI000AA47822|nr:hypothetical protein [Emergencia timonensis]
MKKTNLLVSRRFAKGVAQVNSKTSKMKARRQVQTAFCAINPSFFGNEGAQIVSGL